MYKVKLTPRTAGSKRNRKAMMSEENFMTVEDARRWIIRNIHEQEKTAWRQIGLVEVRTSEVDGKIIAEILPALRLYKGLILTYTIIEC